jgi:hypothetical protein
MVFFGRLLLQILPDSERHGTERVFFLCSCLLSVVEIYMSTMKWNQPVAASTIQRHGMCRLQPKPRTDPGSVRARELLHIHVASAKQTIFVRTDNKTPLGWRHFVSLFRLLSWRNNLQKSPSDAWKR